VKYTTRIAELMKIGIIHTGRGRIFRCMWCGTIWKADRHPFGGFKPDWCRCPLSCPQRCPESPDEPAAYRAQRWPEGVPVQPATYLQWAEGYSYFD
jgi:hypothetical protein